MSQRYEMRLLENGWAVWDTQANAPAIVEGRWQTDLSMEDADDLTDLLNRLDEKRKH
jgi:hypothetical protein